MPRAHAVADSWVYRKSPDGQVPGQTRRCEGPHEPPAVSVLGPGNLGTVSVPAIAACSPACHRQRLAGPEVPRGTGRALLLELHREGEPLQDDGASGSRCSPATRDVVCRHPAAETRGHGRLPQDASKDPRGPARRFRRDELDSSPDSRTATGLAGLGPTDNALTWCALWGISQFPIAMRVNGTGRASGTAVTSGHIRHRPGNRSTSPCGRDSGPRPAPHGTGQPPAARRRGHRARPAGLHRPAISAAHAWLAVRMSRALYCSPSTGSAVTMHPNGVPCAASRSPSELPDEY